MSSAPAATPEVVIHFSDLHVGRGFQRHVAERLLAQIEVARPSAVVASGDFTMRARRAQFAEARELLERIKVPLLVIPGNHDVPLYNLFARITKPFANYNAFAAGLGANPIVLQRAAIYGINSVNPMRHQQGHVPAPQLIELRDWLATLPRPMWRIIVTHQHFVAIPGLFRPGAIPDAERLLSALSQAGAHAMLCGHMHFKFIGSTRDFFPRITRPVALVHAGTVTSRRLRGPELYRQLNNFMKMEFYDDHFTVTPYDWDESSGDFLPGEHSIFDREMFGGR